MIASITFLGATGTVTGSRFLLEIHDGRRLLIDCGLFQGLKENRQRNWEPFPVAPAGIDRVLLTHAHIDHSGYLPRLCREGFTGPVTCTPGTHKLCQLLLRDSAHLQGEEARWANKRGFSKHKPALPLYTVADADRALSQFDPIDYGQELDLDDATRITFHDAGHILGSSFIQLRIRNNDRLRRILFSGDLGSPNRPILNDPEQIREVDYLIVESTYGNRLHTTMHKPRSREEELAQVINAAAQRGGMLIIPAFAVERAQELLFHIRELEEQERIPVLPVYLDSPMAVEATRVFESLQADYDYEAKLLELDGVRILRPKQVRFIRDVEQSKQLHAVTGPAILISASGMLEGGRILHHLERRLGDPATTVLFVGYQAEGTRGRAILNGRTEVKIHGQLIPVKARIASISGFSGHADYREALAWMQGFNRPPRTTFIVHGEPEASQAMAEMIRTELHWQAEIPAFGQTCTLR